ncbi:MAG: Aromatic amino acid permease [Desulfomicrobiaceae bacterium]|jgi:tyrosine-specific transport protein|nr:tryptophan/tyrosine permease [Desulfomicrobiaceae bacterium]MBZ4686264.1 Aromatic amino acid permease [Desulfomicrobiaceae bacterium]
MARSTAQPNTTPPVFSIALVITGNMLGAGILGLPVKTGIAGFVPAIIGTVAMWALMLATALIYASQKSFAESAHADLPSFFQRELGNTGKWITIVANLIILYGLLTAYISGAAAVMESLLQRPLPAWIPMLFFFGVAAGLSAFGMDILRRGNTIIMILMWATFLALVLMTGQHVNPQRLAAIKWRFLPITLPILVTAFHFHNIIPSICRTMHFDFPAIAKTMALGTGIGLVMNILWSLVVIGALPLAGSGAGTIEYAFLHNLPATVPLADIVQNPFFTSCALTFALLAITAAFMANGTALSSFIGDLTASHLGSTRRGLVFALTFLPPLAIAILYPAIFLSALDLVGGVGICLIFGILPGLLVLKHSCGLRKLGGWAILFCFALILLYELGQEFGLLHLAPDAEYWNHVLAR